jgi:hypothetical protein
MGNINYSIDTTIKNIYQLNDDVIGVVCDPNPVSFNELYKNTPFYDKPTHPENQDLYLDKNIPIFNDIYKSLKIGDTYNIKYDHILSKNFDDEYDYKNKCTNLKDIFYNYKLKKVNHKERTYTNYITHIKYAPIYKKKFDIYNIIPYDDTYYELDTEDYILERLLIDHKLRKLITKDKQYELTIKKSNVGKNFYIVIDVDTKK